MDNDSVVEQIVRSLSFEVEAVPQDNILELTTTTTTTKSAPLNVKIRVRKKGEAAFQNGVLSLPKSERPDGIPKRVRLVSSDQTIMSFNVVMEADFQKPTKNPRKNLLRFLKPTSCLGAQPSEDDYTYLPSTTYNAEINRESASKSDGALTKFTLSKNNENIKSKKSKDFFGKCKPGGCLDPPFNEDRRPYLPANEKEQIKIPECTPRGTARTPERKRRTSSILSNKIFNRKRNSSDNEALNNKVIKKETKTESVVDLYQVDLNKPSTTYSNSILTYPPAFNSSEQLRIHEEKQRSSQIINISSKHSFNVHSGSYFTMPKTPKKVLNKNVIEKIENEGDINDFKIDSKDTMDVDKNIPALQELKNYDKKLTLGIKGSVTDVRCKERHFIESLDSKPLKDSKTRKDSFQKLSSDYTPYNTHIQMLTKTVPFETQSESFEKIEILKESQQKKDLITEKAESLTKLGKEKQTVVAGDIQSQKVDSLTNLGAHKGKSVDAGKSQKLDSFTNHKTDKQQSVNTGKSHLLDSFSKFRMENKKSIDAGKSLKLDSPANFGTDKQESFNAGNYQKLESFSEVGMKKQNSIKDEKTQKQYLLLRHGIGEQKPDNDGTFYEKVDKTDKAKDDPLAKDIKKSVPENKSSLESHNENDHILQRQITDENKFGDKSVVTIDAKPEISVFNLPVTLRENPLFLKNEGESSDKDLGFVEVPNPIKRDTPLEIIPIEGNDLQQIWKNEVHPLMSNTIFQTYNGLKKEKNMDKLDEISGKELDQIDKPISMSEDNTKNFIPKENVTEPNTTRDNIESKKNKDIEHDYISYDIESNKPSRKIKNIEKLDEIGGKELDQTNRSISMLEDNTKNFVSNENVTEPNTTRDNIKSKTNKDTEHDSINNDIENNKPSRKIKKLDKLDEIGGKELDQTNRSISMSEDTTKNFILNENVTEPNTIRDKIESKKNKDTEHDSISYDIESKMPSRKIKNIDKLDEIGGKELDQTNRSISMLEDNTKNFVSNENVTEPNTTRDNIESKKNKETEHDSISYDIESNMPSRKIKNIDKLDEIGGKELDQTNRSISMLEDNTKNFLSNENVTEPNTTRDNIESKKNKDTEHDPISYDIESNIPSRKMNNLEKIDQIGEEFDQTNKSISMLEDNTNNFISNENVTEPNITRDNIESKIYKDTEHDFISYDIESNIPSRKIKNIEKLVDIGGKELDQINSLISMSEDNTKKFIPNENDTKPNIDDVATNLGSQNEIYLSSEKHIFPMEQNDTIKHNLSGVPDQVAAIDNVANQKLQDISSLKQASTTSKVSDSEENEDISQHKSSLKYVTELTQIGESLNTFMEPEGQKILSNKDGVGLKVLPMIEDNKESLKKYIDDTEELNQNIIEIMGSSENYQSKYFMNGNKEYKKDDEISSNLEQIYITEGNIERRKDSLTNSKHDTPNSETANNTQYTKEGNVSSKYAFSNYDTADNKDSTKNEEENSKLDENYITEKTIEPLHSVVHSKHDPTHFFIEVNIGSKKNEDTEHDSISYDTESNIRSGKYEEMKSEHEPINYVTEDVFKEPLLHENKDLQQPAIDPSETAKSTQQINQKAKDKKLGKKITFDDDLKGNSEITKNAPEITGLDKGFSEDPSQTERSERKPMWEARTILVNFGIQSYVDDNNMMIIKSFDEDSVLKRYPHDTVTHTKRYLENDHEIKILVDPVQDLFVQIKRNVQSVINEFDNRDTGINKPPISKEYENGVDQVKRNVIITEEIRKTLEGLYEKELLPLRNTISELRDNIEMLKAHHMIAKGHMFVRKPRATKIVPLYRKCACMKK